MINLSGRYLKIGLLLLLFWTVAGCQSSGDGPVNQIGVTVVAPTPGSGYPAQIDIPPYPGSVASAPSQPIQTTPEITQTTDPQMGIVKGTLQFGTEGDHEPVAGQLLYLGEIIKDSEGEERVASLNRSASPRTYTDPDGSFQFINVPPGRYGLILDTVIEAYLLSDPQTGASFAMTVNSGETLELGDLVYEDLPLPSQ
jgi:hypothetical protein